MQLTLQFIRTAVSSRMQYRSDFLIGVASVIGINLINLFSLSFIFRQFGQIAGWTYWEVVVYYSGWMLSHSIHSIFFQQFPRLESELSRGQFDSYLVKPCSTLTQFIFRDVSYMGVGDFFLGSTMFILAYQELALHWGLYQWSFFCLAVLSGTIVETSVTSIIASLAFWIDRSSVIDELARRFFSVTQYYPLDIFGRNFQIFTTAFLPVAFVSYYPVSFLLKKPNAMAMPILGVLSPLVALISLTLAMYVWQSGLKRYQSSGS